MRPALSALLIALSVTAPAWAQQVPTRADLAEARRRFERGIALHDRGDDAGAVVELRVAWALSHRPSALYNLGVALQALRRDDEALEAFRTVLTLGEGVSRRTRRDVEDAIATLEASRAFVRVELTPANASVQIDGRDVSAQRELPLLAGEHRVVARLDGFQEATETFALAPREHRALRLTLAPVVAEQLSERAAAVGSLTIDGLPPGATCALDGIDQPRVNALTVSRGPHRVSVRAAGFAPWEGTVTVAERGTLRVSLAPLVEGSSRRWMWVSFGAAGALAIGAAVLGGLAVQSHDEFLSRTRESPDVDELASRGRALSTAADVFGVAALAGVVAGVVFLVKGDARPQPSSAVYALSTSGGAGLGLRF